MFIDGQTGKIVGPRIKPLMVVTEIRSKTYTNFVEDPETGAKVEVSSSGFETEKEVRTTPPDITQPVDSKRLLALWKAKHATVVEHAKRCKKPTTSECPTCLKNIELMAICPANILPEVLA
jgi:hypothetical protein